MATCATSEKSWCGGSERREGARKADTTQQSHVRKAWRTLMLAVSTLAKSASGAGTLKLYTNSSRSHLGSEDQKSDR